MFVNKARFIENHKSFFDFDGFNDNIWNRIVKTQINYFNDNNKDYFINYFVKEYKKYTNPLFIIVDNESKKKNKKEYYYF